MSPEPNDQEQEIINPFRKTSPFIPLNPPSENTTASPSQVTIWKETALRDGRLTEITMDEEKTIPIRADRPVFYTSGLHGCLVYLDLDLENESAKFGHVNTSSAHQRIQEWQHMAARKNTLILVPDIPEFKDLSGEHVFKYDLNLNFAPDSFAEGMALQESPHIQSVCIYLEIGKHVSGYLNAFERTANAKWPPSYLPKHIAKKLDF